MPESKDPGTGGRHRGFGLASPEMRKGKRKEKQKGKGERGRKGRRGRKGEREAGRVPTGSRTGIVNEDYPSGSEAE